MLENIIRNPIETARGIRNPDTGIPIRGPLSSFFSALYLKPLDELFANKQVTYLRFQDDILILCQTKRQLNRCRQTLMQILAERKLVLSGKKSCRGPIEKGFHFLGIDYYSETQALDNGCGSVENELMQVAEDKVHAGNTLSLTEAICSIHLPSAPLRFRLHARTLRNAREQVKRMVADGFSATQINRYLLRWAQWWIRASSLTISSVVAFYSSPSGFCRFGCAPCAGFAREGC